MGCQVEPLTVELRLCYPHGTQGALWGDIVIDKGSITRFHKKEREKDKANVAWLDGENFVCAMCDLGWVGVDGVMGERMRNRPMYRVFSRTQTKVSDQLWRRNFP